MKTTLLFLLSIFFISFQLFAQRNHNDRNSGRTKDRQIVRKGIDRSPKIEKPKIKTPRPDRTIISPKPIIERPTKSKIKHERNPITVEKFPKKKKKKRIVVEENIEPIFCEVVTAEIYEEPIKWQCYSGRIFERANYLIMDDPYPYFPLRLNETSITYKYTDQRNNYYNLEIKISARLGSYYEKFAVIVDYGGIEEKLIVFNIDENFLEEGFDYDFSQQIMLNTVGYKNLRIGYFDTENNYFYPELFIPKKTDNLIFVEIDEINLLKRKQTR